MKLYCSVVVINRQCPSLNIRSDRKHKNATLAIMKPPKESVVYVLLITQHNKSGFRYKIRDNVEKTFRQFEKEGKTTIRFKEPAHDICITAEPVPLKNFMTVVKKIWRGEEQNVPEILNEKCIPQVKSPTVIKMEVQRKQDYPVLKGFPNTLQVLNINDCQLKRFDVRILRLKCLGSLCLSRNNLTELPEELGLLKLIRLSLADNKLVNKLESWSFLMGPIADSLQHLDISNNKMGSIPSCLCRLLKLKSLKLNGNNLTGFPFRICHLPRLEHLDLSHNSLESLPGTITRRHLCKLDSLDVSDNPSLKEGFYYAKPKDTATGFVPSLFESSSRSVIDHRLGYDEETLPRTIIPLLDDAKLCLCGRTCIRDYGSVASSVESKALANTVISTSRISTVPISYRACCPRHLNFNT